MATWHVYILECKDKSLYTGITNDLPARIKKHKEGLGAKYTRSRGVKKLVYRESCGTHSAAAIREAEIKKLTRVQKLKLIKKCKSSRAKTRDPVPTQAFPPSQE